MNEILYSYEILNILMSILSLIGCLAICANLRKNGMRTYGSKMIAFFTYSLIGLTVANFLTPFDKHSHPICTTEAILRQVSILSIFFWSACIAILSYQGIKQQSPYQMKNFYERSIIFGVLIITLLTLTPFLGFEDARYRRLGQYCAIKLEANPLMNDKARFWVTVITYLLFQMVPFIITIAICIVCYYKQAKLLKSMGDEMLVMINVDVTKLLWYPVILFILFLPSFVGDILWTFFDYNSMVLMFVSVVFSHPIGFIYAFLHQAQVRRESMSLLRFSLQAKSYEEENEQYQSQEQNDSILSELSQIEGLSVGKQLL